MKQIIFFMLMMGALISTAIAKSVLIIADEWPQMDVLQEFLETEGKFHVEKAEQTQLPKRLSGYHAVFMFIHGKLQEEPAQTMVDYAKQGGRLVVMHHGISRAKQQVKVWIDALGMHLPTQQEEPVHYYTWIHNVDYHIVNLQPHHYITSHKIHWPTTVEYRSSDSPSRLAVYPAMQLFNAEVFLNHNFKDGRQKTVLLGFLFQNPETGEVIMQDRAGWYKPVGKGWVFYFQPGHSVTDFQQRTYCQMILNSLTWKP